MNAKKDIAVGHVGEHAFEVDQMLAQHGDGSTDFENGDEDGGPEGEKNKKKRTKKRVRRRRRRSE